MKIKKFAVSCCGLVGLVMFLASAVNADNCPFFSGQIKYGTKGDQVTQLQKFLVNQKLLTTTVYGTYGPATKKAVINFQKINKILQTGNFDSATLASANLICTSTGNISNAVFSSATSQAIILPVQDVNYLGGTFVKLTTDPSCNVQNGYIDWGDGAQDVVASLNSDDCKKGFTHLYPEVGDYKANIYSGDKIYATSDVNILPSYQENVAIDSFTSQNLSPGLYSFKWITRNASVCKITDPNGVETDVDVNNSKIFNTIAGKLFKLTCTDESDRQTDYDAVAGDDSSNPNFLIRYYTYVVRNGDQYFIWDSTSNASTCSIVGQTVSLSGGAKIITNLNMDLSCYSKKGNPETKEMNFNSGFLFTKPIINSFSSQQLDGNNVLLNWNVSNALNCTLQGGNFSEKILVDPKSGSKQIYQSVDSVTYTLICSTAQQGIDSYKDLIVNLK